MVENEEQNQTQKPKFHRHVESRTGPAIGATRRDITVPHVSLNECQKSAVRTYWIQPF